MSLMVRVPCKLGMRSFSQTTNYLPSTGLLNITNSAVDRSFLSTHMYFALSSLDQYLQLLIAVEPVGV